MERSWAVAMAATVSRRGSRGDVGDNSWARVVRSTPALAANAVRLRPLRRMASSRRSANNAGRFVSRSIAMIVNTT